MFLSFSKNRLKKDELKVLIILFCLDHHIMIILNNDGLEYEAGKTY